MGEEGVGALYTIGEAQLQDEVKSIKVTTESPEETQRLGSALAQSLHGGEVILLTGGLGAGKTCLTQGIAWGLGVQEYARSPTFVLISEYQGRLTLYHIDLYRLDDIREIADLGLEEYLYGDGVCVIEWAEKATAILPDDGLAVRIDFAGTHRRIFAMKAHGDRYETLLEQLSVRDPALQTPMGGG